MNDNDYMKIALELAKQAARADEVPVGAIVVRKSTGEIVGKGFNRRETDKNPLAHAEISAIKEASETLGGWRLIDCEMYVTLEPCPMCCGAIINSRIERVVFGANDLKSGSAESVMKMFDMPFNHRPEIVSGVMKEECSAILSEFFAKLRKRRKKNS
ncbi:MAG: tRNA adenosine(34) deaminase TadA [Oscillospiraceae bacterium]|nr:tRNA adenosine(34) deaminase TadA [Oscillospiraceae bacterium]